jgi:hypothetical protein
MRFFKSQNQTLVVPTPGDQTAITVPTSSGVPWQRILVSLFGIAIIFFQWRWATENLYTLQPYALPAFTSITVNSQYVVAALAIFFVTGKLVYDWKNSTVSQVIQSGESIVTEDRTPKPKYFDSEDVT